MHTVLEQTDPGDPEFRDHVILRHEGESMGAHLERILSALKIEVRADHNDVSRKVGEADVVICNHPSTIDILVVGELLGDIPYTVVTQRKRAAALKRLFGEDAICPAPLGGEEETRFAEAITKSLSDGRKLILFPSGGAEIKDGESNWLGLYKDLLASDALKGKNAVPLRIDTVDAGKVQSLVGDKEKGREIFPEVHYTIPDEPMKVSVVAGDVFVVSEESERRYKETFNL